ncbi:MAG: ribosomal protein L35 [Oceanicoccus sp.]|jgi:ribosomal protein L35
MPGKAKPGKQRSHSGAKKRASRTASGKVQMQKAATNHRLNPKNKRQLTKGGLKINLTKGEAKKFKVLLPN